ncbi:MAG: lipocalin-like domain-containing protein [Pseudomonadota bacterium]
MTLRMAVMLGVSVLGAGLTGCDTPSDESGFAGLAESAGQAEASAFLQPEPGTPLVFPDDWGPHPQHRIEWWYFTANLTTPEGRPLGVQWTQFRQALQPRPAEQAPPSPETWPMDSAWMAHGALSFNGDHWFEEKLARGDIGHAGASAEPFRVWLDDWELASVSESGAWHLQVQGDNWGYDLTLSNTANITAHGDDGFSAKSSSGEGSMYFSLAHLRVAGTVTVDGRTLEVSGKGWFDREWSSQFLKTGQQGWDWFGLHLEDGQKLMAFRLREGDSVFSSGSWINAGGDVTSLQHEDLTLTPTAWKESARGRVPVAWHLRVPGQEVDLRVEASPGEHWNAGLFPYWESPVSVSGSHDGKGYMELTGYAEPPP